MLQAQQSTMVHQEPSQFYNRECRTETLPFVHVYVAESRVAMFELKVETILLAFSNYPP